MAFFYRYLMQFKKFKLVTHGCRTNQYETQAYRDQLLALGYKEANEGEKADICIVNSCTVTRSADTTSMRSINRLLREQPTAKVVVTGCMAEAKETELLRKGVGLVVLNQEKDQLMERLFPDREQLPEFSIRNFEAHT